MREWKPNRCPHLELPLGLITLRWMKDEDTDYVLHRTGSVFTQALVSTSWIVIFLRWASQISVCLILTFKRNPLLRNDVADRERSEINLSIIRASDYLDTHGVGTPDTDLKAEHVLLHDYRLRTNYFARSHRPGAYNI